MARVCNGFLGFDGQGKIFPCASFEQWLRDRAPATSAGEKKPKNQSQKISYEERKEYARIEKMISKAEKTLEDLKEQAHRPEIASDPDAAALAYEEIAKAKQKLETLITRWEELEEKLGQV
jgi:ATP-binding cassette subfamily F protein uup